MSRLKNTSWFENVPQCFVQVRNFENKNMIGLETCLRDVNIFLVLFQNGEVI